MKIFIFVSELENAVLTGRTLHIDKVISIITNEKEENMQDVYKYTLESVFKDHPEFIGAFLERLMK